jgi:hypothetical protein
MLEEATALKHAFLGGKVLCVGEKEESFSPFSFSARLPAEPHKPYVNKVAVATKQWVKILNKELGTALAILGFLLLLGGIVAYFYAETYNLIFFTVTVYPHRNTGTALIIVGFALLITGIIVANMQEQEQVSPPPSITT